MYAHHLSEQALKVTPIELRMRSDTGPGANVTPRQTYLAACLSCEPTALAKLSAIERAAMFAS